MLGVVSGWNADNEPGHGARAGVRLSKGQWDSRLMSPEK